MGLGFKFIPFQNPFECWADSGHIYVREGDKVHAYDTSLTEHLEPQINPFVSDTAMWVLYDSKHEFMYVGNSFGSYQVIRLSDGVMVGCGSWKKPYLEWKECGIVDGMGVMILLNDKRTIALPHNGATFRLDKPVTYWDMMQAEVFYARSKEGVPIVVTERGMVDFERDGSWVPTRHAKGAPAPLRV